MNKKNRKRNNQIIVRMTDEEKSIFDEKVKQSGLTQSEYFRKMALGENVYILASKEEMKELFLEIHKQGNNVNQIAKNLNSGIYVGASKDVKELNETYRELILKVTKLYNRVNNKITRKEKKNE